MPREATSAVLAQWRSVKRLPHKHEDLSQIHGSMYEASSAVHTCNPRAGKGKTGKLGRIIRAHRSAKHLISESRVKDLVPRHKGVSI